MTQDEDTILTHADILELPRPFWVGKLFKHCADDIYFIPRETEQGILRGIRFTLPENYSQITAYATNMEFQAAWFNPNPDNPNNSPNWVLVENPEVADGVLFLLRLYFAKLIRGHMKQGLELSELNQFLQERCL